MRSRHLAHAIRLFVACALALAVLALPSRAAAQPAPAGQHDAQLWVQGLATVRLSTDWLLHLEVQPRWSEDAAELNQVIFRTALGRRLGDRVTIWGGYAWVPRTLGPGTRHEQRAWQQLSATFPAAAAWTPSLRVRLEQRWLDGWADNSHRLRLMGRVVRPLERTRTWSLAVWNEAMFTFDKTAGGGPPRGVDQNRAFAGILRRLSSKASIETGYLWQTIDPPGLPERTHAHVGFVWLNLAL